MAKPDYWATAPWSRKQFMLVHDTLDDSISSDHPVRVFEDILSSLSWTEWEAGYSHSRGRPPIHPRKIVGLVLYGLSKGLRSSRDLEEACHNQLDFLWLMEGLAPDHSTICSFRVSHEEQLKSLFRRVCQLAAEMGLVRLNRVAIDGTSMRANNGRHRTLTRETIAKRLDALDQQIAKMLDEAAALDRQEDSFLGDRSNQIPAELQNAQERQRRLQEALEILQELDDAKKKDGVKTKSQVPETDPDSRVLPNKDGGFAPNYTAMVATDGECGVVVDCEVIQGNAEGEQTVPMAERIRDSFDRTLEALLADGAHAQGRTIGIFEEENLPFYSPLPGAAPTNNPALRADPKQPVPEDQWDQLPCRGTKNPHFDKAAFVYVPAEDAYYCPLGKRLSFVFSENHHRGAQVTNSRRYQTDDCSGCPLMSRCISQGKRRTIRRDQYSEARERHAAKMQTDEAQAIYKERMGIVEATFGTVKGNLSFRQFLLRGLSKVRMEWRWLCVALNLMKLVTHGGAMRAEVAISRE